MQISSLLWPCTHAEVCPACRSWWRGRVWLKWWRLAGSLSRQKLSALHRSCSTHLRTCSSNRYSVIVIEHCTSPWSAQLCSAGLAISGSFLQLGTVDTLFVLVTSLCNPHVHSPTSCLSNMLLLCLTSKQSCILPETSCSPILVNDTGCAP